MTLKPLYDKLTPSQRSAVDDYLKGDDFELLIEISRLTSSIARIFKQVNNADVNWVQGQCQHFLMILAYLEWIKQHKSTLTVKDIKHASEPKTISRERFARFRSLAITGLEENDGQHNSRSPAVEKVSPNQDGHNRKRDSVPTGHAKKSTRGKQA